MDSKKSNFDHDIVGNSPLDFTSDELLPSRLNENIHYRNGVIGHTQYRQSLLIGARLEQFWPFLECLREHLDIRVAADARDLFYQLENKALPDLILLDVDDPGMTALASCRKIKRNHLTDNIPVILLTDEVHEDEEIRAYECDCSDYISLKKANAVIYAHIQMQLHFKRTLDELNNSARVDGLTQVFNRREFDLSIAHEWRRIEQMQGQLSLLIIDVDYFKLYNDQFGHLMGDDCLRLIAERIRSAVQRSSDRVFRYGGEEFAVLMPELDCEGAAAVAETLRNSIEMLNIALPIPDICSHITVSIGVASIYPNSESFTEQLVSEADAALYRAKDLGRNLVFCAV